MRTPVKTRQNKMREDKGHKPKEDNTITGVHKRGVRGNKTTTTKEGTNDVTEISQ